MEPIDRWRAIGAEYYAHCWRSATRPHRQVVVDAVARLMPINSVLEIGCNGGVNLDLLQQCWPTLYLEGVDASQGAIDFLHTATDGILGHVGDVRTWLAWRAAESYDVVLSCYCLAYLTPDELKPVLVQMLRIARVGLVIAEPMVFGPSHRYDMPIPEWAHDYTDFLDTAGRRVTETIVSPPAERLNSVITVSW